MEQTDIQRVAIYLRKSRDEGDYEDVLSKHRDVLVKYAEKNHWQYTLYEEVESGARLINREKMQTLLVHLQAGMYDGVLVMDIDRLSRGDTEERGKILNVFYQTKSFIITPEKICDPEDDDDETWIEFKSFFAKLEYKQIKKRLYQGKQTGANRGMWTNGKPPYPYEYDRTTKTIRVNEEKRPIYRMIMEKYLSGSSLEEVAVWLNTRRIKTPAGKIPLEDGNKIGWTSTTLNRLLMNEVHLGLVVYGKHKGDGHRKKGGKVENVDPNKWIRGQGTHEVLKTQEEHERIKAKLKVNTLIPSRSKERVTPLSGLLFCKQCGRRMQFRYKLNSKGERVDHTVCAFKYPDGTSCEQVGIKLDEDFYAVLYQRILNIDEGLQLRLEHEQEEVQETRKMLEIQERERDKVGMAITRLFEGYEDGSISKQDFIQRKAVREQERDQIQKKIDECRSILNSSRESLTIDQVRTNIELFKDGWREAATSEEKNIVLSRMVEKIIYDRPNYQNVELMVIYR